MNVCHCTICQKPLAAPNRKNADLLAEHRVYKLGELDYIELAHAGCAKVQDPNHLYWDYEAPVNPFAEYETLGGPEGIDDYWLNDIPPDEDGEIAYEAHMSNLASFETEIEERGMRGW